MTILVSAIYSFLVVLAINTGFGGGHGRLGASTGGVFVLADEDAEDSSGDMYFYYNEKDNTVVKEYINEEESTKNGSNKKKENLFMDIVDSPYVVEFYSPNCPACQQFKSHYMEVALQTTQKYPSIQFYAVSCDKYVALCEQYNVDGYPTLRLFPVVESPSKSNSTGIDMDNSVASVEEIAKVLQVTMGTTSSTVTVTSTLTTDDNNNNGIYTEDHRRTDEVVEVDDSSDNNNNKEEADDNTDNTDNTDNKDTEDSSGNEMIADAAITSDGDNDDSQDDNQSSGQDTNDVEGGLGGGGGEEAEEPNTDDKDDEKDDEVDSDKDVETTTDDKDDEKDDDDHSSRGSETVTDDKDDEKDEDEAEDESDNGKTVKQASDDGKDDGGDSPDEKEGDSVGISDVKAADTNADSDDADADAENDSGEDKKDDDEDAGETNDKTNHVDGSDAVSERDTETDDDEDKDNGAERDAKESEGEDETSNDRYEGHSEDEKEDYLSNDSDEENLPDVTDLHNAPPIRTGHYLARNKAKQMDRFSPHLRSEKEKYMNRRKGLGAIVRKDGTRDARGRPLPRYNPEEMTRGMRQNTPGTDEYRTRRQAMLERVKRASRNKYAVTNLKKEELPFKKDVRKAGLVKKAAERIPVVKRAVKMSPEEELIMDASHAFTILLQTGISMKMNDQAARMALRKWLDLMSVSLPPEWAIHRLIDDLRRQFMFITKSRDNLQSVVRNHPLSRQGWSKDCRKGGTYGFSCGFWKLMHTMAVGVAEQRGGKSLVESEMVVPSTKTFSPAEAADTIRNFIDHFYTCKPCRDNFISTYDNCENNRRCDRLADDADGATTADWKELSLWLWEVHNDVSIRLVHERVGSSYGTMGIRKQVRTVDEVAAIFPSVNNCIQCFNDDGTWNEGEVFFFLERTYWPGIDVDPKHDKLLTFDDEASQVGLLWVITFFIVWLVYSIISKKSGSIHESMLAAKIMVSKAGAGMSLPGSGMKRKAGAGKKDG